MDVSLGKRFYCFLEYSWIDYGRGITTAKIAATLVVCDLPNI